METETPILDFAPMAMAAIIECHRILEKYGPFPDEGDHKKAIIELLDVLDDSRLVDAAKAALTGIKKPTGLSDTHGVAIFDGDPLSLNYHTVHLDGFAKLIPLSGVDTWCIYKDDGNFLEIERNRAYITKT